MKRGKVKQAVFDRMAVALIAVSDFVHDLRDDWDAVKEDVEAALKSLNVEQSRHDGRVVLRLDLGIEKARKISKNDERILARMREQKWNSASSLARIYHRFSDSHFNMRHSGYVVHKKMGHGDQYHYILISGPGGKIWG